MAEYCVYIATICPKKIYDESAEICTYTIFKRCKITFYSSSIVTCIITYNTVQTKLTETHLDDDVNSVEYFNMF
jgi:hypothetical protein